jgi:hypothetical protein
VTDDVAKLLKRVRSASGRDQHLDRDIARCLKEARGKPDDPPPYTASVDACIGLIERVTPGWHWHVGYGPKGVMPYAFLSNGEIRCEAIAATVPLALLTALLEARTDKHLRKE